MRLEITRVEGLRNDLLLRLDRAEVDQNVVVLPLSAAGRGPLSWPVAMNGVLIHLTGVGLPSSLFASATRVDS